MSTDDKLDFGTDPCADLATTQIAMESPCAGGCGKSWEEAGGGWRGFMSLDGDKTCVSPVWHCDPCFKAKDDLEWVESQTRLPEHVQALRQQQRDLMEEAFGAGNRRRLAEMLATEERLKAELRAVTERLQAAYATCGYNPDPAAVGKDEPLVH